MRLLVVFDEVWRGLTHVTALYSWTLLDLYLNSLWNGILILSRNGQEDVHANYLYV